MVDVGCALSYVLGTEFDNPATELHLIDPLARFYNKILDSTRNDRQRLREGMIELLSTLYEPGSVDVVHVVVSLLWMHITIHERSIFMKRTASSPCTKLRRKNETSSN